MKKFQLTIPTPCHENWEAMTAGERGRFCGSCQKTVIDFSTMSDRQIAEFFKRPKASVCGRFHADQLERTIEVQRKRIPWVKYFFQITWPAFVLFLKSCGQKNEVVGKLAVKVASLKQDLDYAWMGNVLPQIKPVDSLKKPIHVDSDAVMVKGEIALPPEPKLMGDTIVVEGAIPEEVACSKFSNIDTSKTTETNINQEPVMIAGGISIRKVDEKLDKRSSDEHDVTEEKNDQAENLWLLVYPNPARAGGQITIKCSAGESPKKIFIHSSNGQFITSINTSATKTTNQVITLPAGLVPGTYFLQAVTEKLHSRTTKIIIN